MGGNKCNPVASDNAGLVIQMGNLMLHRHSDSRLELRSALDAPAVALPQRRKSTLQSWTLAQCERRLADTPSKTLTPRGMLRATKS